MPATEGHQPLDSLQLGRQGGCQASIGPSPARIDVSSGAGSPSSDTSATTWRAGNPNGGLRVGPGPAVTRSAYLRLAMIPFTASASSAGVNAPFGSLTRT